ncbi:MAG: relaxase domain-containing protein, partial [Alphaproteobacteria bacterium]|nr:relaxase domain-containing protein [Alphaproteobacteria bacterium]
SPKRFNKVLLGYVPGTDIRLGRMRDGEHQHRPGRDITLSAPKSVSLAALLHGDRRVVRAHDEAVRAALDFVEAELLQTRGWDPATRRRPRVKAHGMVAAAFRHLASRNLEPQLHTHCVVANMTRNGAGEWRSIEATAIRRNRKLIGAHYRNELARRLEALGYETVPTMIGPVPGFELAGYGRGLREAFSTRRRDILEDIRRRGGAYSAARAQQAALYTRRRKAEPAMQELRRIWRRPRGQGGSAGTGCRGRLGPSCRCMRRSGGRWSILRSGLRCSRRATSRRMRSAGRPGGIPWARWRWRSRNCAATAIWSRPVCAGRTGRSSPTGRSGPSAAISTG